MTPATRKLLFGTVAVVVAVFAGVLALLFGLGGAGFAVMSGTAGTGLRTFPDTPLPSGAMVEAQLAPGGGVHTIVISADYDTASCSDLEIRAAPRTEVIVVSEGAERLLVSGHPNGSVPQDTPRSSPSARTRVLSSEDRDLLGVETTSGSGTSVLLKMPRTFAPTDSTTTPWRSFARAPG